MCENNCWRGTAERFATLFIFSKDYTDAYTAFETWI